MPKSAIHTLTAFEILMQVKLATLLLCVIEVWFIWKYTLKGGHHLPIFAAVVFEERQEVIRWLALLLVSKSSSIRLPCND